LRLDWAAVAGSSPGADGADPANAAYDWSSFDAQLQAVVTAGLTPIVDVLGTPRWAAGDGTAPAPANLQAFAAAAIILGLMRSQRPQHLAVSCAKCSSAEGARP